LPFASLSKQVFVQNNSYENMFPLQVILSDKSNSFSLKGFVQGPRYLGNDGLLGSIWFRTKNLQQTPALEYT